MIRRHLLYIVIYILIITKVFDDQTSFLSKNIYNGLTFAQIAKIANVVNLVFDLMGFILFISRCTEPYVHKNIL